MEKWSRPTAQRKPTGGPTARSEEERIAAALASGVWKERSDPRTQRKFYINSKTKKSVWNLIAELDNEGDRRQGERRGGGQGGDDQPFQPSAGWAPQPVPTTNVALQRRYRSPPEVRQQHLPQMQQRTHAIPPVQREEEFGMRSKMRASPPQSTSMPYMQQQTHSIRPAQQEEYQNALYGGDVPLPAGQARPPPASTRYQPQQQVDFFAPPTMNPPPIPPQPQPVFGKQQQPQYQPAPQQQQQQSHVPFASAQPLAPQVMPSFVPPPMPPPSEPVLEGESRYQVLQHQPIGSGGFGTVFMGFDIENGTHVAVKQTTLPMSELASAGAIDALRAEYGVLEKLSHPNIVRVFEHRIDPVARTAQIFMEWMSSGSVKSIIDQTGFRLHENVIRRYTAAALEGLAYLHGKNVLHRDVKPANMLVSGDGIIKLSDFGTSRVSHSQTATTTQHVVGTCAYMAPESIQRGKYSTASDMWALGCSIVEMATGRPPWDELTPEQKAPIPMMFFIGTAQPPNHHPHIPTHLSKELQDIAARCFAYDPKDRGNAGELRQLGYFTSTALPEGAEPMVEYRSKAQEFLRTRSKSSSFGFPSSEVTSVSAGETGEGLNIISSAVAGMAVDPAVGGGTSSSTTVSWTSSPEVLSSERKTESFTGHPYKDVHMEAAERIQSMLRMMLAKKRFQKKRNAIRKIQRAYRHFQIAMRTFGRIPKEE